MSHFANTDLKRGHVTFRVNWIKPFFCVWLKYWPPISTINTAHTAFLYALQQVMEYNWVYFLISVYCLCITWCICVALTSLWQLEGVWLCVCVYVYVCARVERGRTRLRSIHAHSHTHTHASTYTDVHVVGWCVLSRLCSAGTLFDLKSIIVHLNNLACVWTNCVGTICRKWILLNMHFCVRLKTAELKKKKKTVMSNLFIVVSVLLENPVFRCTLYIQCCTLQRYTLFWYNIVQ